MKAQTWTGLAATILMAGCATGGDLYDSSRDPSAQATAEAQRLMGEAVAAMQSKDVAAAERLLREAISHDVFHAPAHNNLGILLLERKEYHRAAWEFEFAAKAQAHAPEPHHNLGLVYERVGKYEKAAEYYEMALARAPKALATMENLARILVLRDAQRDRAMQLLDEILLLESRDSWREWAQKQLLRLKRVR